MKNKAPTESYHRNPHQAGRGYIKIYAPDCPHADKKGYAPEHIVIAAKALGRALPAGVEVHHVNEIRSDNRNCNLVICQDAEYHQLLHRRIRALKACGNPNWRICNYCHKWDDPNNLTINEVSRPTRNLKKLEEQTFHMKCKLANIRKHYTKEKDRERKARYKAEKEKRHAVLDTN